MRKAPEWFVRQITQEHDGRLRIRWSPARFRWQIEQRVDTAKDAPFEINPLDDDTIRAVDGYARVCEVAPGTITPCTNIGPDNKLCGYDLRVPFGEFVQIKCPKCVANGFHGGITVGHYELNDHFLAKLREIDPNRGAYERVREHIRHANKALVAKRTERARQEAIYGGIDLARTAIIKTGYTGRERMWTDAPSKL